MQHNFYTFGAILKKTIAAVAFAAAGFPAIAADYYVVVPVHGRTGGASAAAVQVQLNATALPRADVGTAYSYDFKASLQVTGDAAYTGVGVAWSVSAGTLPSGLTLNPTTGIVSGVPLSAGTSSFSLTATYKTKAGVQSYQVAVASITVGLTENAALPAAMIGAAYNYDFKQNLQVAGDVDYVGSGVTWAVSSGVLPAGLTLNSSSGVLSGTPTAAGTSSFSLTATYKTKAGAQSYQVVVPSITVGLTTNTALPTAMVGQAYSYDFKQNLQVAGDAAYAGTGVTWAVTAGALPAGLVLNSSSGVVSGAPTADGTASFTLTATYKTKSGGQAYQVAVALISVVLADAAVPLAKVGTSYSYDFKPLLTVTNDQTYSSGVGVSWSLVSGTLPQGLTLNANGTLTGTPQALYSGSFEIGAGYKAKTTSRSYAFSVARPYSFTLVGGQPAGTTTFADTSGYGVPITRFGNVAYSSTVLYSGGTSIYFDGSGDYLLADAAVAMLTGAAEKWTVSASVYQTAAGSGPVIFAFNSKSNGANVVLVGPTSMVVGGKTYTYPSTIAPLNTWSAVDVSYDGATLKVYQNGVLVLSQAETLMTSLSATNFGIGVEFDSANAGTPGNYFPGYMADIKFSPGYAR